jgi:hypothetical protein
VLHEGLEKLWERRMLNRGVFGQAVRRLENEKPARVYVHNLDALIR